MSSLKLRALAGVCALVGSAGLSAAAHAQVAINGDGSSLLAPYWRQAGNCFGADVTTLLSKNANTSVAPTTNTAPTTVSFSTTLPSACAGGSNTINYESTGSGAGIATLFSNDPFQFGPNTAGTGNLFSTVDYALSDNALVDQDVANYNGAAFGTASVTNTEQGLTFNNSTTAAACGNGVVSNCQYPFPKTKFGPLVQFPVSIDPVAIAYAPTYGHSSTGVAFHFNVQQPNADGSGGLKLSQAVLCGIFNGTITNWNDPSITALNVDANGTAHSLQDPNDTSTFSLTIVPIGRSDSSGTTSIFTRALAAVCGSANYTTGTTTLPASVVTAVFHNNTFNGSGGVATAINSTPGGLGYIGPDFVLPAVNNTGANTFGLQSARVANASGQFEEPLAAGATIAFGGLAVPTANFADPTVWVASTNPAANANSAAIANPTISGSYPIVGTTNFLGYTCYASASVVTELQTFLTDDLTNASAQAILSNAGLAPLPSNWTTAIVNNFISPTTGLGGTASRDLFFAQGGTGSDGHSHTNSNCTSVAGAE